MPEAAVSWSLMPHQEEGVRFLLERGSGLIAFEQGLGKTLVAITAFERLREDSPELGLFVICPNSLKANWRAELKKFAPHLSARVVPSGRRPRRRAFRADEDVVIVNYEGARADILSVRGLLARRSMVMVVDESHAVKNADSLTTIATANFSDLAAHRWLLSGTPVTNSPADIYSQLKIVAPEKPWGSLAGFEARFGGSARPGGRAEALGEIIRPYVLRRTKAECLDLPDKTFIDVPVRLPPWQRELYDQARKGTINRFSAMGEEEFRGARAEAFASLTRLLQIATDPGLVGLAGPTPSGKDLALDKMVDGFMEEPGQKVIIWSNYVASLRALRERYQRYGAKAIYGEVPLEERQEAASAFQKDPNCRVLVANPAAAGTGYTLTAATVSIYHTLSWRYDFFAQSQDRNHRIGQEDPVKYLRLLASDTLDEAVVQALARKKVMAQEILGDEDDRSSLLSMTPSAFCQMLAENRLPKGE